MSKLTVSLVLVLLLVSSLSIAAASAGDPLDSNDLIFGGDAFADSGCAAAERYPHCVPCWTQCLFAMMADADFGGQGGWGW